MVNIWKVDNSGITIKIKVYVVVNPNTNRRTSARVAKKKGKTDAASKKTEALMNSVLGSRQELFKKAQKSITLL